MGSKSRAGLAGVVGLIVALGVTELVHGLYDLVPSVLGSLAQVVVEWTPGGLVTRGIELLGQADIPVLIASVIVGMLVVSALLGILAVGSPALALLAVAALGVLGITVSFVEPFINPVATVVNVAGALLLGTAVAESLLRRAGLRETDMRAPTIEKAPPASPAVRSREAGSNRPTYVNRGAFLALGGLAALAGLVAVGVGRLLADGGNAASAPGRLDLPRQQGSGAGENGAENDGGEQAVTHKTLPPPPSDASINVPGMPELITPASSFYLIDAALTSPRVNRDDWKLSVKGAVDNPVEFSYGDLLGMSTLESDTTLSCVSNPVGGGLVSNGRWTGVLLSDVLREAGVRRENITAASEQLVGRSVDGFTAGFRTEIALDGRQALVAFGLNDSELPIKHGYPVRLVVPGLYGYVSATKWLSEIELTNWDFDAYWIQRTWTKEGPVKTQSRIDTVKGGDNLESGTVPVGGVAWAPHRGISRVEVSTDNGETWNEARLASQLSPDSWRQYVYQWDARPGDYTLQVRATDGEGQTQTSDEQPPHGGGGLDGASGYHTIDVSVA